MELINKFIDREQGGSDFTWAINEMVRLEKRMTELNSKSISVTLDLKSDNATLDKVLQKTKELNKLSVTLADTAERLSGHKKVVTDLVRLQINREKQEAAIIKEKEKTQRLILQIEQKKLAIEEKRKAAAKKSKDKEEAAQLKKAAKEARELERAKKQLERESARLEKQIRKEAAAAEYNNRQWVAANKQHKDLLAKARDVGMELGVESKEFLAAARAANELGDKMKKIDGKLGIHTRNVGNYTSAWNGLNYSVGNLVSELPNLAQSSEVFFRAISNNILPIGQQIQQIIAKNKELAKQGLATVPVWRQVTKSLLGWQTALILGVTLLVAYGDELVKLVMQQKKVINTQTQMKKLMEDLDDSYLKTATELEILKKRFYDVNTSMKEKERILKTLDERYGGVVGGIKSYSDAEKFFIDQSDAYVAAMKQRAVADAAYSAIAKNKLELYKLNNATEEDMSSGGQKFLSYLKALADNPSMLLRFGSLGVLPFGSLGADEDFRKDLEKNISELAIREFHKRQAELKKEAKVYEQILEDAEESYNNIVDKFDFNFLGKDSKDAKDKSTASMLKSLLKDIAKAEETYSKQQWETAKETNKRIYEDDTRTLEDRLAARHTYFAAEMAIEELAFKNKEAVNLIQHNNNMARIQELTGVRQDEAIKGTEAYKLYTLEKERYDKVAKANMEKYSEEYLRKLDEYTASIEDITDEHEKKARKKAKDLKEWLDRFFKAFADTKPKPLGDEEYWDKINEKAKEIQKYIRYIADIGAAIGDIVYEPQIAKQEQIIENLNASRDLEIANIRATSATEQEANERIADYEARRYVAQQAAEREKMRLKIQAANIDKAANILEAAGQTAIAVTEALPNTALAAVVAAAGAAAIAALASRPVPQYYTGVTSSPETWAYVGERGRELRVNPDGSMELTPNTATLTYLQKGTTIVPHRETNKILEQMTHSETHTRTLSDGGKMYRFNTRKLTLNNDRNTDRVVKELRRGQRTSSPFSNSDFSQQVINRYK